MYGFRVSQQFDRILFVPVSDTQAIRYSGKISSNLQRLLRAGNHGDHVVREHELSRANLVTLRQGNDGGSVELAVISSSYDDVVIAILLY